MHGDTSQRMGVRFPRALVLCDLLCKYQLHVVVFKNGLVEECFLIHSLRQEFISQLV